MAINWKDKSQNPWLCGKQFDTFSTDAYAGNPGLCRFPLTKECGENKIASPFAQDDDDSIFASGFTWELS